MRAVSTYLAVVAVVVTTCSQATVQATAQATAQAPGVLRVESGDQQLLKERLLSWSGEHFVSAGLFIDRRRAWMNISGPLPVADAFDVRATWPSDISTPSLPLTFELRPVVRSAPGRVTVQTEPREIRITLAVSLQREVLVAGRRLRKGSALTCADLSVERREIRLVPKQALGRPCNVEPDTVALRDIAARDVMRGVDLGRAPDVLAGEPVRVSVSTRGINITTAAIALADARVGDQIDVRLKQSMRALRTRVTAPGSVQLLDASL